MTSIQPTSLTERHTLLDVLRGFALLGVLLANMVSHAGYFFLSEAGREALSTSHIDHYVEWVEHFLIDGKFYSLFSMLFGIGFALQLKRSSDLDDNFLPRFRRRLLIMFILGLLHAIFLYLGDILTVYALIGLVLILFRNANDKFLLRSAFILTLLPIIQYSILWGINLANPPQSFLRVKMLRVFLISSSKSTRQERSLKSFRPTWAGWFSEGILTFYSLVDSLEFSLCSWLDFMFQEICYMQIFRSIARSLKR